MQRLCLLLVGLILLVGCRSTGSGPGAEAGASTGEAPLWQEGEEGAAAPRQAPTVADGESVIIPVTTSTGVVASVNAPLRFVVLDYALSQLPKIDQRLFLYRRGQKVARVKVTGPVRGQTVAADIIEGNAEEGDEVRPD